MSDLRNAIISSIDEIEKTSALFYQQKSKEGFQALNQTLGVLLQTINILVVSKSKYNELNIDEQKLNAVLGKAMTAMEKGDNVLLSDILIFELKNTFEEYLQLL